MDIAASLIKLFFGSKADKDRKEVEPYLVKIKAVYPTIEALSNDELRARSSNLKKQIADFIAADEARHRPYPIQRQYGSPMACPPTT